MLSRIIWLFLSILLASLTALLSWQAWRAFTTRHWPVTDGVVVAFYQTPNYRYSTGGRTYVGSHVSCNEFFNQLVATSNSAKYAVRYPLDAKVTVHYCPDEPALAILETRFDYGVLLVIGMLLLTTLLCAAGFRLGWRFRARPRWRI